MFTRIVTILALAAGLSVGVATAPADAASRSFAQRCVDQHSHPRSTAAKRCERRDWVITRSYVMAPDGRLWTAESGWNVAHPVDFDETLPQTSGPYWFNNGEPCTWGGQYTPSFPDDDNLPLCPQP